MCYIFRYIRKQFFCRQFVESSISGAVGLLSDRSHAIAGWFMIAVLLSVDVDLEFQKGLNVNQSLGNWNPGEKLEVVAKICVFHHNHDFADFHPRMKM